MIEQKHLIIITHDMKNGLGQIVFGFHFALTLKNMEKDVAVFLTGEAVRAALKDSEDVIDGKKIDVLKNSIQEFLNAKGELFVCSTCVGEASYIPQDQPLQEDLISGVQCVGLSTIAEISLNRKVITF